MRALKLTALAAVAALTLAGAVAPASAGFHFSGGHGFGGPHFGGGHGWGGHGWGGRGWGGAGLVFGLGAAALAAGAYDYCTSYVPVYDAWGNVVGQRPAC